MTAQTASQNEGTNTHNIAAGRLAWLLATMAIIAVVATFWLGLRVTLVGDEGAGLPAHLALTPFAIIYAAIGALITTRQPRNAIGWIFLAVGLLSVLQSAAGVIDGHGSTLGLRDFVVYVAEWLGIWLWMPITFMPLMFVFLLFPDGRLLTKRWRIVLWSAISGLLLSIVAMAFHPGPLESWDIGPGNPFGIPAAVEALEIVAWLAQLFVAVGIFGSLAAFIVRFRRSRGQEREQMKWLFYALVLVAAAIGLLGVVWFIQPEEAWILNLSYGLLGLTVMGIAVAAGIAILRYHLYDINLVINRTLVYGALTISIVVLYALIVGGLSALFQAQGDFLIALLATGAVVVLFQPLRDRLQQTVNQIFYGKRDDPLGALTQLGRRLETAPDPEVVLPTLVETIAQTLKLPYVAIRLQTGESSVIAAASGTEVSNLLNLPLIYQGKGLGELLAGPRGPGEAFSPADQQLLTTIAHQAGPAVHTVQLTAALRQARLELVTTREEERRRLRRDLHDGLGATLAALNLEAGAVRRWIRRDPDKAEAQVDEFRADIRAAIDDIRKLVYELRPPTLDQLGLVAAVRAQAAQCSRPAESDADDFSAPQLKIEVDAPEEFSPLPAAVEVAAFRITQEALTNVVHHAQARRCLVRLAMGRELTVEIRDDGVGLTPDYANNGGLGLLSMRERAVELGGTFQIGPAPEGGTRILATIPLPEA